jgi:serine/threonine-protein kinase
VSVSAEARRRAVESVTLGRPSTVVITGGSASAAPAAPPAAPAPVAESGTAGPIPFRVGEYEVAARVARGGTGSVYVCRAASDPKRLLTLKVIRQHALSRDLAEGSFNHEAMIGSLFRHPNAHTVLQTGVYDGQPFLILEYFEGGCLADMLTPETRPPPAVAVAIVLDVLSALAALHQVTDASGKPLGLLHCDVSPDNVLVGINGMSRLADFGSARVTARANQAQPFAISKPPYMPPEQFRGDPLDARSDIYSAGMLLWTALTGKPLFAAATYEETMMNVMRSKPKPPSSLGAPEALDGVVMQAISRAPDRRFAVAGAMATALREAATPHRLVASRDEVGRWVRTVLGDELAQRRRDIDAMFGGGGRPPAADAAARSSRPAGAKTAPAPTPSSGGRSLSARTIFMPSSGGAARPKLTYTQQALIALASCLAFAATVGLGLAFAPRPATRARPRAAASSPRPAPPPRAPDLGADPARGGR